MTLLGAVAALMWSQSLVAQEIAATRTLEAVEIDGVLDEAEWNGAASIEAFTQLQPVAGAPASQSTVIRVLYDERMVYFGIDSRDTDPAAISRTVTRRDGEVWEDDAVALVLDTFDDDNNAYVFMVNSLGTQQDERWADNGRTRDITWDANWLSAGSTSDRGWTAEVAIPFETVRRVVLRVLRAPGQGTAGVHTGTAAAGRETPIADREETRSRIPRCG